MQTETPTLVKSVKTINDNIENDVFGFEHDVRWGNTQPAMLAAA